MADASSTSNTRDLAQQHFTNSTPPSTSSSGASSAFEDSPNKVPQEYLMASPSSLLVQGFPFPPQQPTSDIPLNLQPGFIRPEEPYMNRFKSNYENQPPNLNNGAQPSSSKIPEFDQHSSAARLVNEQRLSTCLNILRHIQRTLRQRHDEATLRLAHISRLEVQTTWELFFQSPLDFMCHEMDILSDATASAILSHGGISLQRHSAHESEAWMRKLDELRDLQDDEHDAKERVRKTMKQMQCADAIMRVGLEKQAAALERGDLMGGQYRGGFDYDYNVEAMASSNNNASAMLSGFFNWPLPATSLKVGEASNDVIGDNSSGSVSGSSGQCHSECCRDHSL
ncbi:hypothetical protein CI102_5413 [Trichoderma harzianum]|uniref:Uncharacterized protein n=1 Tax=Trichoderma harzianum CBS 226.95 TaxID=983964 RepID=A0A2T4AGI8_TRIHA|nr:hypothetical protein M431DRAFT_83405 [Trichoderma harzianum CBS 226.95]PKK51538.1 hypothetical protein CI102_5413 [Trichoderma harzianum]PTB56143.1 hypothetical protein M431DRAFT_83405 [Trichoderma harzianum CBS 226.95]